jgi:hypothetical protein
MHRGRIYRDRMRRGRMHRGRMRREGIFEYEWFCAYIRFMILYLRLVYHVLVDILVLWQNTTSHFVKRPSSFTSHFIPFLFIFHFSVRVYLSYFVTYCGTGPRSIYRARLRPFSPGAPARISPIHAPSALPLLPMLTGRLYIYDRSGVHS